MIRLYFAQWKGVFKTTAFSVGESGELLVYNLSAPV